MKLPFLNRQEETARLDWAAGHVITPRQVLEVLR